MASPGHLTVTLPQGVTVTGQGFTDDLVPSGGYKFDLFCEDLAYESQEPYRNVVLDRGETDYQSINPDQGVAWEITANLSNGVGGHIAKRGALNDGKYGMADNFDAEYMCPGPRQVDEYPGIPFGVTPVGFYKAGTTDILWTDSAAYALFRRVQGGQHWVQIGGNVSYTQGAVSLANTWSSLSNSLVKCVAHLGNTLLVGFGSSAAWLQTSDYTAAPPTWAAGPETGDDAYAHVAANATFEISAGVFQECIIFLGDNGKLFKTANVTAVAAAALAGGATIGDATGDTANSMIMLDDNTIIAIGKDTGLYLIDTAGNVGSKYARHFPIKTTSDSGGATPANFRDPTDLGGYTYWLVGDYAIVEREPVDGTFTEFSVKAFGQFTPRMQLPILAMCAGPDGDLYVALGTTTASFSLTNYPAGTQLLANTITTDTTYLFKGRGKAHLGEWTWHGSLESYAELARKMWYSEEIQRLFLSLVTDSSDRALSYMRVTKDTVDWATPGTFTNIDTVPQASATASGTALDDLSTLGSGDAIIVGHSRRFTSIGVDIGGSPNVNAATIAVAFSTGAGTWTAVGGLQDGTQNANATLSRDGIIQWNLPGSTWVPATYDGTLAYWVRISLSNVLDNDVEIDDALIGYGENLRQFVVVSGDPLLKLDTGPYDTSGTVKLSLKTASLETGKFSDSRPLDIKAGRKFAALTKNIAVDASTGNQLVVKYRSASDRSTSVGFDTLATYTTDALAEAGTSFPTYDADNPPNFKEGMRVQLQIVPTSTLPLPVRLSAAVLWFVDANPQRWRMHIRLGEPPGMTRHGGRAGTSLREMFTNLQAWRDAVNPVAVVVDNDLGLSMNMRLAPVSPRWAGMEKNRQPSFTLIEVI